MNESGSASVFTSKTQGIEETTAFISFLVKIALVCNPENMSDGKFFETVTQNRGLMVKVTTDMEEAVAWLGSDD